MNKENQDANATEGKNKSEEDRETGDELVYAAAANGAQYDQTISEGSREDPERGLRDPATHEDSQDA